MGIRLRTAAAVAGAVEAEAVVVPHGVFGGVPEVLRHPTGLAAATAHRAVRRIDDPVVAAHRARHCLTRFRFCHSISFEVITGR